MAESDWLLHNSGLETARAMFLVANNAMSEGNMGRKYQSILDTIGNTPVVRINRLAPQGVNLFVKIEAFNPLGSVKDRLALGVIEAAEQSGELKPGQTVIEATSGNTGIGLAMVCAAKGYPLVVTMAEPFSVERRKLMRFLGAKVIVTPAAERAVGMITKTIELAKAHGWYMTRQFENEANPDFHSRTTAREILDDFSGQRLDYWVTGYGTGGTLKGVARVSVPKRRLSFASREMHSCWEVASRSRGTRTVLQRHHIRHSSRIRCKAGRRILSPNSPTMPSQ
jgi:threonine dehydratase